MRWLLHARPPLAAAAAIAAAPAASSTLVPTKLKRLRECMRGLHLQRIRTVLRLQRAQDDARMQQLWELLPPAALATLAAAAEAATPSARPSAMVHSPRHTAWPVRAEHHEPARVPRRGGRHRAARRRLDAV